MEKFTAKESGPESMFLFPNIEKERGEIERVAQKYSPLDPEAFTQDFYAAARLTKLTDLTEDIWEELDNTDSFDIPREGWAQIAEHVDHTNKETAANRSWEDLKQKLECGQKLDAPIILKHSGKIHLVSGNTRLMVARALSMKPKVLLVEI
jgi:hypothetical protein